jgi:putative NIF3 family GTP cyclohydrolase 1 type 2
MRTSVQQDKDFISGVVPSSLLEDSIDYITANFEAEEVYGLDYMIEWAKNWTEENGYTEE